MAMYYDARAPRPWPPSGARDDRPLAFRGTLHELPLDVLSGMIAVLLQPRKACKMPHQDDDFSTWTTSADFGLAELSELAKSSQAFHAAIH
jgi:hypothetical protein